MNGYSRGLPAKEKRIADVSVFWNRGTRAKENKIDIETINWQPLTYSRIHKARRRPRMYSESHRTVVDRKLRPLKAILSASVVYSRFGNLVAAASAFGNPLLVFLLVIYTKLHG